MENTITPNYEKLIGKKREELIHNIELQNSLMEYFNGTHHDNPDEHVLIVFGRIAWEARELEIEIANFESEIDQSDNRGREIDIYESDPEIECLTYCYQCDAVFSGILKKCKRCKSTELFHGKAPFIMQQISNPPIPCSNHLDGICELTGQNSNNPEE